MAGLGTHVEGKANRFANGLDMGIGEEKKHIRFKEKRENWKTQSNHFLRWGIWRKDPELGFRQFPFEVPIRNPGREVEKTKYPPHGVALRIN